MSAARDPPLPQDGRKIRDIERDKDPLIRRSELEDCFVVEALQLGLAVERSNVVPARGEWIADVSPRHVGVEEQPHAGCLSVRLDLKERKQLSQVFERTPVLSQVPFDFLREALGVGASEPDVTAG